VFRLKIFLIPSGPAYQKLFFAPYPRSVKKYWKKANPAKYGKNKRKYLTWSQNLHGNRRKDDPFIGRYQFEHMGTPVEAARQPIN
jgi:hypothetical protein